MEIFSLLSPILSNLINKIFPDPEKAQAAQLEMQKALNEAQVELYKAQAAENENRKDIIIAEINKTSVAANWRAYMMFGCVLMLLNAWMFTPILNAVLRPLGYPIELPPMPPEVFTLMTVGLGGYLGRETVSSYANAKYAPQGKVKNE